MHKPMEIWKDQWRELIQALEQKSADTYICFDPPAEKKDIEIVESRLGVLLPDEFRSLLEEGAAKAQVCWNLPGETIIPFEVSGDVGWDLKVLDFSDFADASMNGQKRYLSFHLAGNGDELLLDLHSPSGTSVVHWAHETAAFRVLAPTFTVFLERVTELGCVGAEEWQYPDFCDEQGLNPGGSNGMRWKAWLHQYLTLTVEQAQQELPMLILYTEMNGIHPEVESAFARYSQEVVLQAWVTRAVEEPNLNNRSQLLCYAGDLLKEYAADFVRTLWGNAPPLKVSRHVRSYLSSVCLPAGEGLKRVVEELDKQGKDGKLSGYEANSLLQPFRSQQVLKWMEDKVSFPFDGWDTLYIHSQPGISDVIQWLEGKDVQRRIVISALSSLPEGYPLFGSKMETLQVRGLLERLQGEAVLKKEKQAVQNALDSLVYLGQA